MLELRFISTSSNIEYREQWLWNSLKVKSFSLRRFLLILGLDSLIHIFKLHMDYKSPEEYFSFSEGGDWVTHEGGQGSLAAMPGVGDTSSGENPGLLHESTHLPWALSPARPECSFPVCTWSDAWLDSVKSDRILTVFFRVSIIAFLCTEIIFIFFSCFKRWFLYAQVQWSKDHIESVYWKMIECE